jgi:hypothetical protein
MSENERSRVDLMVYCEKDGGYSVTTAFGSSLEEDRAEEAACGGDGNIVAHIVFEEGDERGVVLDGILAFNCVESNSRCRSGATTLESLLTAVFREGVNCGKNA